MRQIIILTLLFNYISSPIAWGATPEASKKSPTEHSSKTDAKVDPSILQELEELIKKSPQSSEAHFNVGVAQYRLSKYQEALVPPTKMLPTS
ncbi:MAG: hypothetical protein ACOX2O_09105 [Bdellovibrionota bacterium]|jgi:hypothetical protein